MDPLTSVGGHRFVVPLTFPYVKVDGSQLVGEGGVEASLATAIIQTPWQGTFRNSYTRTSIEPIHLLSFVNCRTK